MHPTTIKFAVRVGYVQTAAPYPLRTCLSGRWLGCSAPIRSIVLNNIDIMDRKIGFEMSLIVVEAIRGRCASFKLIYFVIIDSAIPVLAPLAGVRC